MNAEATRSDRILDRGSIVDQIGYGNSPFVYPVVDGKPFAYETRSLPWAEDPVAYHQYRIARLLHPVQIAWAVQELPPGRIRTYFEMRFEAVGHLDAIYGQVAPAFGRPGGATQIILPLTVDELCVLGVLEPVDA